jgi:hypothetical protein
MRENPMRIIRLAAVGVVLAGPAYAQMPKPSMSLTPEAASKTPEQKEAEAERERAYKESLKKIPDAKGSTDPWGAVRSSDSAKSSGNSGPTKSAPNMSASAKPKAKTGSSPN